MDQACSAVFLPEVAIGNEENNLNGILEELRRKTEGPEASAVSVGGLVDALDEQGYGAALAILPLIELTPIGGIPGVPTMLALILAILCIRLLLGYEHFWVPNIIRRQTLKKSRVEKSVKFLKPLALRIDEKLHERLTPFSGRAGQRAACIVIVILLLSVPPLELIPFATSGPMIVIAIFGLGILFRDGLLMLLAFVGAAIALGSAGLFLMGRFGSSGA